MRSIARKVWRRAARVYRAKTVQFRSPARGAIIGCGGIAPAHVNGYDLTGRVKLAAVSDVRGEAMAAIAAELPQLLTFRDYRQMLVEVRPDVISICTWPRLRLEIIEAAAEAGVKGILCEKPLALQMSEVDQMLAVCERAKIKLAVGHQNRFHPMFTTADELVQAGRIGKIREIRGEIASSLANNGPHLLDLIRFLLGDPRAVEIRCECERNGPLFNRGLPAEAAAEGDIQFEGGVEVHFRTGTRSTSLHSVEIIGETGTIQASLERVMLNGKRVAAVDEQSGEVCRKRQFSEFIDWVQGRSPSYKAAAQSGALSTELVLAAYDSARQKQSVRLPLANRGDVIVQLYPDRPPEAPAQPRALAAALSDRRLALNGGPRSVTSWFQTVPHVGLGEVLGVSKVVLSGKMNGISGTVVPELESAFAKAYACPKAVASTSGTAAIHVAVAALDPEPGQEIITTPLTDMGSIIPILWNGCIPIFADVDPLTGSMTAETIAARITAKTRAVILVHFFGRPSEPGPIAELCQKHGIALIEDCAQAHFAEYGGKKVGTFGAFGCLSLQQSKQITCGDGGITLVNDVQYAHRAALFIDKAWNRKAGMRAHEFLGLNYRMTEMQAAVALAQLRRLPGLMERRRRTAEQLSRQLASVNGVKLPSSEGMNPAWWIYNFAVDEEELGLTADDFCDALLAEGVRCRRRHLPRPIFDEDVLREQKTFGQSRYPFSLDPNYKPPRTADYPGYLEFDRRQIILPWASRVTAQQVSQIAAAIRKVAGAASQGSGSRPATPQLATAAAL